MESFPCLRLEQMILVSKDAVTMKLYMIHYMMDANVDAKYLHIRTAHVSKAYQVLPKTDCIKYKKVK